MYANRLGSGSEREPDVRGEQARRGDRARSVGGGEWARWGAATRGAGSDRKAAGTGRAVAGAGPGRSLDFGVLRVPRSMPEAGVPRDDRRRVARWRRVVRNLVLGVLVLMAVAFVAARSVEGSAPPVGETIVVRQGDTMWSIASRHYPDSDPRARIEQIERLNHRDGSTVHPGEKLQLPATR
jgi:LysM repeat protein